MLHLELHLMVLIEMLKYEEIKLIIQTLYKQFLGQQEVDHEEMNLLHLMVKLE